MKNAIKILQKKISGNPKLEKAFKREKAKQRGIMFIKDFTGKWNNLSLFARITSERILFDRRIVGYAVMLCTEFDHGSKVLFSVCKTQDEAEEMLQSLAEGDEVETMSIDDLIEEIVKKEMPKFSNDTEKVIFINTQKARRMQLEIF